MPSSCARIYRFGDYELDAEERRLRRSGSVVALRPKPFDTLLYLARRHGHVVTKAELLDRVWQGTVVSESALTRCIKEVRKALCDDASQPRYIETRARIGYTFVAAVGEIEVTVRPASIAVLPVADLSPQGGLESFADGLTEELIAVLTGFSGLHVAASTSSFACKGERCDIRQLARRLDVDALLEGSVRSGGRRLRITLQLVDGKSGYHLWSQVFDREMSDALALQKEIGLEVVRRLEPREAPL